MGEVIQFPLDTWDAHVRFVAGRILTIDCDRAEKFFATETRRVAAAYQAAGCPPQEVSNEVDKFVADVHQRLEHERALRAEGRCAHIIWWSYPFNILSIAG